MNNIKVGTRKEEHLNELEQMVLKMFDQLDKMVEFSIICLEKNLD